ncbi:MAG: glycosyltransferase [Planctomycetota bacterium]|jgi:glycosyltransferase involved in cell wall biosynthesis|nr:glycosyltransferase [Planctomycetota bacterium]
MPDHPGPRISVIVPAFNAARYLEKCLDSVLAQTFRDFEIVCVDDGSADASGEILERYRSADGRIKIIRQPANAGQGRARNAALAKARGEYLLCLDADDWLLPPALERAYAAARANPASSVTFKFVCYLEREGRYVLDDEFREFNNLPGGFYVNRPGRGEAGIPVFSWNKLFKREALARAEIEWGSGRYAEDDEFHYKFFYMHPETYVLDECLYVYRRRDDSTMGSVDSGGESFQSRYRDYLDCLRNIYGFLGKNSLYREGKESFQALLIEKIASFMPYSNKREVISEAKKLLADTGFPSEYRGGDAYPAAYALYHYRRRPWLCRAYGPLKMLLAMIPARNFRRKWRTVLRIGLMEGKPAAVGGGKKINYTPVSGDYAVHNPPEAGRRPGEELRICHE